VSFFIFFSFALFSDVIDLEALVFCGMSGMALTHLNSFVLESITTEQIIIPMTRSIVPEAKSGKAYAPPGPGPHLVLDSSVIGCVCGKYKDASL
jgi:hypothetical protein